MFVWGRSDRVGEQERCLQTLKTTTMVPCAMLHVFNVMMYCFLFVAYVYEGYYYLLPGNFFVILFVSFTFYVLPCT